MWFFKEFFLFIISTVIINKIYGEQHKSMMVLEAYWESAYLFPQDRTTDCLETNAYHTNFIDIMANVPVEFRNPHTTVTIAFADLDLDRCERPFRCRELVCGLKLYEDVDEDVFAGLISSIKRAQQDYGSLVKLSFGGSAYGNLKVHTKVTHVAQRIVDRIVRSVDVLGVDGVDLMQAEGCGRRNMWCDDQTSIHLYILDRLRSKLPPGKLISYSFPVSGRYYSDEDMAVLDFPFIDVVKYGHDYLNSISLMGVRSNKTIQSVLDLGVPASKIMWGLSKGCRRQYQEVRPEEAEDIAQAAKKMGLSGITMWSLNRGVSLEDINAGNTSKIVCSTDDIYPDASYFRAIAKGWK